MRTKDVWTLAAILAFTGAGGIVGVIFTPAVWMLLWLAGGPHALAGLTIVFGMLAGAVIGWRVSGS